MPGELSVNSQELHGPQLQENLKQDVPPITRLRQAGYNLPNTTLLSDLYQVFQSGPQPTELVNAMQEREYASQLRDFAVAFAQVKEDGKSDTQSKKDTRGFRKMLTEGMRALTTHLQHQLPPNPDGTPKAPTLQDFRSMPINEHVEGWTVRTQHAMDWIFRFNPDAYYQQLFSE